MPDLNPNKFPRKNHQHQIPEVSLVESAEKPAVEKSHHETGKGKKSK
jgi:hypothetical protein